MMKRKIEGMWRKKGIKREREEKEERLTENGSRENEVACRKRGRKEVK